ncbi:MAG: sugar ABC transporter substrate-binding protein [Sphaerochaetaceae bacterium]
MRKRVIVLVVLIVFILTSATSVFAKGAKEEAKPVVAFSIMDYSIDFLVELLASARKTASELGIDLRDYNSQFDTVKQVNNIEDAVAQKVDCILVHPVESSAVVPGVLAANDANIPIVAVDIQPTSGDLVCFVASDNENMGRLAAQEVVSKLKARYGTEKGTIVIFGNDMISSMRLRKVGARDIFSKYPGIEIVDTFDFATKLPEAMEITENVLQKHKKGTLDFILALNDVQTLGADSVVMSQGRTEVLIMGVDKDVDILNAIGDSKSSVIGTIVQSPADMGRIAVEQCLKAINKEKIEKFFFEVPAYAVTDLNVDEYLATTLKLNKELDPYRVK